MTIIPSEFWFHLLFIHSEAMTEPCSDIFYKSIYVSLTSTRGKSRNIDFCIHFQNAMIILK